MFCSFPTHSDCCYSEEPGILKWIFILCFSQMTGRSTQSSYLSQLTNKIVLNLLKGHVTRRNTCLCFKIIRILLIHLCFCFTLRYSTFCYFSFLASAASLHSSVLVIRLVISRHCSICKVQPLAFFSAGPGNIRHCL